MGSRLGLCSGAGMNDMGQNAARPCPTQQGEDEAGSRCTATQAACGGQVVLCVTCVDLLYLSHVGHRQTISMPLSEFC